MEDIHNFILGGVTGESKTKLYFLKKFKTKSNLFEFGPIRLVGLNRTLDSLYVLAFWVHEECIILVLKSPFILRENKIKVEIKLKFKSR